MTIIMLNLLIAIIGNSYSNIKYSEENVFIMIKIIKKLIVNCLKIIKKKAHNYEKMLFIE